MRLRTLLLNCLLLAPVLIAGAQERQVRDFRFAVETTPALELGNPAALSLWNGHLSMAEVSGRKENGALISLDASPDAFCVGVGTESYYRISDRMVFHGKLSWSDFQGKDMGGQVLMDPVFHPVNFLESSESTVGTKKRELYGLIGELSYQFSEKWSAGFLADYRAGDQTKIKDPRFSNILMDMDLKAGVAFRPSTDMLLGCSLQFRNRLEQVRGGIYGTTDQQYFVATDKGGFFGVVETLSGDQNYMPASSLRPMDNRFYGVSLQVLLKQRFSQVLSIRYRDGYYGKKATTSPVFFEFSGPEAAYEGKLLLPAGNDLHRLSWSAGFAFLGNEENQLRYVTPAGQSTQVEYMGQNHILDRTDLRASADYRWYHDASGPRPALTLGSRVSFFSRSQTTTLYPYYRNHAYHSVSADLSGQKAMCWGNTSLVLDLGISFHTGWGVDKEDGILASSTATSLRSFDNYLGRQFEYDTAARAGGECSVMVARRFKKSFEPYLKLSDRFLALFAEPQYLGGRTRNVACISLGCNF